MTVMDKENKLVENSTAPKSMIEIRPVTTETIKLTPYDKLHFKIDTIKKGAEIRCVLFLEQDFWSRIQQVIDITPGPVQNITINTWTLKDEQTDAIISAYDAKKLQKLRVLTGINFKSKRTDRYARILTRLEERGQRIRSFENHAKICIFKTPTHYMTVESSANLWGHVAVEQFTITESKELYNHHNKWMNEMMNK